MITSLDCSSWFIPGVTRNEHIMQSKKEGDNVGSIVRTKSGMMMKDTILTNGCTHCDVATTLFRTNLMVFQ